MADTILALTEQGEALKAKIEKGEGNLPLEITRIVSGAGESPAPLSMTVLTDPRLEFAITGSQTEGKRTVINAMLTNVGNPADGIPPLEDGYSLSQVGIFALDPDEGEILYRISQYENPIYVPTVRERGWTYTPSYNIVTGNAKEVIIEITPAGFASAQALKDHIENTDNPHKFDGLPIVSDVMPQSQPVGALWFDTSGGPWEPGGIGGSGGIVVIAGNVHIGDTAPDDKELIWYDTGDKQ